MTTRRGCKLVEVLVAIVTYNSAGVVEDLLGSLPAALDGVSATIVVVDNGSADETISMVEGRVTHLVRGENVGYAAAINRAVHACLAAGTRPEAILVLNPDVVLGPASVPAMLEELRRTEAGIVAPLITEPDGTLTWSLRRAPSIPRALGLSGTGRPVFSEWVMEVEAYRLPHDIDWAVGAVLLVATACHEALAGWDPSYFLYSEETDFCLRAWDCGWRTRFTPEAVAVHGGGGSGRSARTHAMQIINRVRLYRRRHSLAAAVIYWVLTCLSEVSWIARGEPKSYTALAALCFPRRRPPELNASSSLIPW